MIDLSQCHTVTVDDTGTLYFYFKGKSCVLLTKDQKLIVPYETRSSRKATRKEIAQAVAACLIHDIELDAPF